LCRGSSRCWDCRWSPPPSQPRFTLNRPEPPPALVALLDGDADAFAPEAIYGYAAPEEDLGGSRSLARGRREIAAALRRQYVQGELLALIGEGRDWFAEGRRGGASFVASLQLDARGAIERALCLASEAIEPSPTWGGGLGTANDARAVLDRYIAHLQAAEFGAAVECFTHDCLYSHPPYAGCTSRVTFRGHDQLLDGFENKRGPSPARQVVVTLVQRGADCFIEGVVEGIPKGGSFVSSLSLAEDGRIRRYAAWYCTPRVPRAPSGE
jgi:hypothetical protein